MPNLLRIREELNALDAPSLDAEQKFAKLGCLKPLLTPQNLRTSLSAVLTKNKLPSGHAALIREIWENKMLADIRQIAVLQYAHMQKTRNWGDLGEQRILISYCRHLLGLPAERDISFLDVDIFQNKIRDLTAPYTGLTAEELRAADEAVKCDLLYKETDYSREKDVNEFLEFLGSAYGFIAGQLGIYRSVIAGPAEIKKINKYRVTTFRQETARTPEAVLSIAAVVGGKHVAIRLPACETIFANKWLHVFTAAPAELEMVLRHELENIGWSFKLCALNGYSVRTAEELLGRKDIFLREMLSGLQWHELGHGIVINELLSRKDSAFGEALAVLGANIIAVFKELLADWAPPRQKLQGPLNYFCAVARQDADIAARQIAVYLSDNWFLGEQDDNSFGNHSEITAALLLKYLGVQRKVDFAGLRRELAGKRGVFYQVLRDYKRISLYLEKLIKAADFVCGGRQVNFAELSKVYIQKVRQIEKEYPVRSLEFQVHFWAKILEDLPALNAALLAEMKNYLTEENQKFHQFLLREYLPPSAYQTLREYVCQELKNKGFYAPPAKADLAGLLQYFQAG
jgi:hypothetical protein